MVVEKDDKKQGDKVIKKGDKSDTQNEEVESKSKKKNQREMMTIKI